MIRTHGKTTLNDQLASIERALRELGFSLRAEGWTKAARCRYGNARTFLGEEWWDEDGHELQTEEAFITAADKAFHAPRADRGTSASVPASTRRAVGECLRCPVWRECLRHACESRVSIENGVYGGTAQWERQAILGEDGRRRPPVNESPERTAFLEGLSFQERLDLLERLVYAKAMGFVPLVAHVDQLARELLAHDPADDGEWWERQVAESKVETYDQEAAEPLARDWVRRIAEAINEAHDRERGAA